MPNFRQYPASAPFVMLWADARDPAKVAAAKGWFFQGHYVSYKMKDAVKQDGKPDLDKEGKQKKKFYYRWVLTATNVPHATMPMKNDDGSTSWQPVEMFVGEEYIMGPVPANLAYELSRLRRGAEYQGCEVKMTYLGTVKNEHGGQSHQHKVEYDMDFISQLAGPSAVKQLGHEVDEPLPPLDNDE